MPKINRHYFSRIDLDRFFGSGGKNTVTRIERIQLFYQSILSIYGEQRNSLLDSYLTNGCILASIHYFLLQQLEYLEIPFENIFSTMQNRIPFYPIHGIRTTLEILESFYVYLGCHEWNWTYRQILSNYGWSVKTLTDYFKWQTNLYMTTGFYLSLVYPDVLMKLCSRKYDKIRSMFHGELALIYKSAYQILDYDTIFSLDSFVMSLVALLYIEELESRNKIWNNNSTIKTVVNNAVRELQLFGPMVEDANFPDWRSKNSVAELFSTRVWGLPWFRGDSKNYMDITANGTNNSILEEEWDKLYEEKEIK